MGRSRAETDVNSIDTVQVRVDQGSNDSDDDDDQHDAHRRLTHAETVLMKFLRPRRVVPTPAQRKVLATEAETCTVDIASVPIRTYVFGATTNSPTVLLSHGFLMNAASMLKFVRPLRRSGLRVVVWDHCGHGESGGDFTDLRVWMRTVRVMAERFAPIAGVVGFSMGGTVALMALADRDREHGQGHGALEKEEHRALADQKHRPLAKGEHAVAARIPVPVPVPALVCVNPPTQMDTVLKGFLRAYGHDKVAANETVALVHQVARQKDVFLPERVRQVLPGAAGALAATRVLVVQDRHDSVASVGEAEWVADQLSLQLGSGCERGLARGSGSEHGDPHESGNAGESVQLRFTEHLDHHGALADEGVVQAVTEFVAGNDTRKTSRL